MLNGNLNAANAAEDGRNRLSPLLGEDSVHERLEQ